MIRGELSVSANYLVSDSSKAAGSGLNDTTHYLGSCECPRRKPQALTFLSASSELRNACHFIGLV